MTHIVSPGPPIDVEPDGRVFAEGETVSKLDEKDPHNQALIDSGRLVETSTKRRKSQKKESS